MFDYSVIYTGKRNVSVSISSSNEITVKCPFGCPKSVIDEFLHKKSNWIESVLNKNSIKLQENEDIISHKMIFVEGKKLPLITDGGKYGIFDDGVYIGALCKLEYIYKDKFLQTFTERVNDIAKICGIDYGFIKIKDYLSLWGCRNARGYICFNYKIFMLPEELQNYVIIHELCHVKYMNHSKNFWNLVKKYMPSYRQARIQLKKYDFITRLY